MIKNNIKIARRSLSNNRPYFLINLTGLALALTVSFLMLLWVYSESTMDQFHEKDEQLYLAKRTIPLENGVFVVAGIMVITITLVTISFQAIRAAIANPVKSLRTE